MSDGTQHDAVFSSIRERRTQQNAESRCANLLPALIGFDELPLAIPWRVGLHQSPPPLHQPADSMRYSHPARRAFFSERQPVSYSLVSAEGSTANLRTKTQDRKSKPVHGAGSLGVGIRTISAWLMGMGKFIAVVRIGGARLHAISNTPIASRNGRMVGAKCVRAYQKKQRAYQRGNPRRPTALLRRTIPLTLIIGKNYDAPTPIPSAPRRLG